MRLHPAFLAFLLIVAGASTPGSGHADGPAKPYAELLEAARKDPEKADFKALRLAFTETGDYKPYATEKPDRSEVIKLVEAKRKAEALAALDRLVKGREMDPEIQGFAADVCAELGETARAEVHKVFMQKIVDTILGAGDGKGFATAWPVLTIREEYVVLGAYDWKRVKQALKTHDGHFFDVLTVKDEAGADREIYFNVDLPRKALRRMLEPAK